MDAEREAAFAAETLLLREKVRILELERAEFDRKVSFWTMSCNEWKTKAEGLELRVVEWEEKYLLYVLIQ